MKTTFGLLLFLSLLAFSWNCSSREFQKISSDSTTQSSLRELTPEEQKLKESALSLVNTGNRELQNKRYSQALELAGKSIDVFPTMEGYYLEGMSLSKLGKNEKASQSLEKALEIEPKNEQVLVTLGLVNSILGEDEKSLHYYDTLTKIKPDDPNYRFRKGVQLKSMKRYEDSFSTLKTIRPEKFPYPTELYSQLGDVCLKLKKYDEAQKYLALAEESSPDSKSLKLKSSSVKTSAYLEEGNRALALGDYDRAISAYKKAVANDPKNASPLVFLSNAYILKKEYSSAETNLAKAQKLNDELLGVYESFSLNFYQKKDYKSSVSYADQGLKFHPKSAVLFNRRGLASWKQGNIKQAKIDFRKASDVDPKFTEAEGNLGFLLLEEGRFLEAKRLFLKLADRSPQDKTKYQPLAIYAEQMEFLQRGDSFLSQGKIQAALVQFDKAKIPNPNEPAVWNAYGRAYFLGKNYPKSEANFQVALGFDENNLESLTGLVRLYSAMNAKSKEKATLGKIQELTKDDPTAQILIGRLKEDSGDYTGAEKDYLSVRKNFPEEEAVGIRLGSLYYKIALDKNNEEKYEEALNFLTKAKKENPNISEISQTERVIRENREFAKLLPAIREANQHFERKRFNKAAELYQAAYDKSGKPNLLVKVAECYVGMGEEERALSLMERAQRENKSASTDFKEAIYSFFLQKGEVDRAENGFLSIIRENPGSYYSYYKLGLIELDRKKYDRAIEYIDRSLMLKFDFAAGNVAKGIAFYRKGDYTSAEEEFKRAQEKDKEMDLAVYNIGILYFNQNMDKQARVIFQDLIKKHPESSEGYFQLSFMDFKSGNLKSAESLIQKALQIERSPANLYAYSRILEAKKDKKNWEAIAREITLKHPKSSYAKKLKAVAFSDEPMYFQPISSQGNLVSPPIRYAGNLIQNFGSSLIANDINSGETKWRIFPKEKYIYLYPGNYLYGVNSSKIQLWEHDTGREVSTWKNPVLDVKTILLLDFHQADSSQYISMIVENSKGEVVAAKLNSRFELENSKVISSYKGKVMGAHSGEKTESPIIIYDTAVVIGEETIPFGFNIRAYTSDKDNTRFLLQSSKKYYIWTPGTKNEAPIEISFLSNSESAHFHENGFIVFRKGSQGLESAMVDEKGAELMKADAGKDWNLQTLILSK